MVIACVACRYDYYKIIISEICIERGRPSYTMPCFDPKKGKTVV